VELAFARVPWDLRADLDRHHLTETIGAVQIFSRLHDAIAAFNGIAQPSQEKTGDTSPDGTVRDPIGPQGAQ
jgi:sulfate permease, SulP family